jgi:two-component system cell cycle sensor histidine kinase/response regulator CckA
MAETTRGKPRATLPEPSLSLEDLAESEQRSRTLLEALPDAVLVHSENRIVFVNPFCVRLLGAELAEQLLGKDMGEIIHADSLPEIRDRIRDCYATGTASPATESILIALDGSPVEVEAIAIPICWNGAPAIEVIARDIRRRNRAEQELRRSEEKYRELFEHATLGIFRSKMDGALLDVNPALVAMLGYSSKEELLTRNLNHDIYDNPDDRRAILERVARSGRVDGEEVNFRRKDGKIIGVRVGGGIFHTQNGLFSHFEVIVENVTERRSLEGQFRQAQKMEAVGLLAGGISHDFSNLLSVILGNSELLLETTQTGIQQHYSQQIIKATQRAAQLTRQLLAFSRKQILFPTILDLNTVVHDVGQILQRVIGEDVQIVKNLDTSLGSTRADRGQIEQILMNLATNARDAMPNGGTFTIQTGNAELGSADAARYPYAKPGPYIRLSVQDSGEGMTDAVRSRVFEPFFTTKAEGRGTGLGLAMIYRIVKQSAGYIWVSSAPGAGTTFDIYLPRFGERAAPLVASPEMRSQYPRGTETILVLEDEESLRQVTCEILIASGYNVLEASRGNDATAVSEQYKGSISLIVSDVVLPDMSGPSIVAKVQGLHPEAKVLYVSGYAEVPVAQELIAKGAMLLQKPLSRGELLRKLDEMLHFPVASSCHPES